MLLGLCAAMARSGPLRFASASEFERWLKTMPYSKDYWDSYLSVYGKPIVRVPVERQTPNEADL